MAVRWSRRQMESSLHAQAEREARRTSGLRRGRQRHGSTQQEERLLPQAASPVGTPARACSSSAPAQRLPPPLPSPQGERHHRYGHDLGGVRLGGGNPNFAACRVGAACRSRHEALAKGTHARARTHAHAHECTERGRSCTPAAAACPHWQCTRAAAGAISNGRTCKTAHASPNARAHTTPTPVSPTAYLR